MRGECPFFDRAVLPLLPDNWYQINGWRMITDHDGARNYYRPEVMSGTPGFRGTRVPFKNLIDYLEGGHPLSEFLRQFPTVTQEMAVRALDEQH
jgi:uncharacterized protein (DUF433 family)